MFSEYRVGDLFDIHPTNAYKMSNSALYETTGKTPVLSNSSMNNGIGGYSGLEPTENGGIITFSDTTTGGDTMFYQADDFIGYPHVQGMYPFAADKWDESCCLYAISAIRKSAGDGWNYAVKFNRTLVKELMIELPVIERPDPSHEYTVDDIDWDYMHERIRELEEERIRELDAYLRATGLDDYELTIDEEMALRGFFDESVSIGKFKIGDLFASESGDTDIQKSNINGLGITVISSGAGNRGVIGATDIEAKVIGTPSITVDMFGNAFYRDEPYKMVTHARVFALLPLYFTLDRKLGEYFEGQIKKACAGYEYNNMCSFAKIRDKEIEVPVNPDGSINFAYIYIYISALEKETIKAVVQYKEKLMSIYRSVV